MSLERVDELVHGHRPDRLPLIGLPEGDLGHVHRLVVVEEAVVDLLLEDLDRRLAPLPGGLRLHPQDPPGHQQQLPGHDHVEAVGRDLGLVHPDELRQVDLPGIHPVLQHQAEDGPDRLVDRVLQPLAGLRPREDVHVSSQAPQRLVVVRERPVEQQVLLQFLYPCVPIHLTAPPSASSEPPPRSGRPLPGRAAL